MEVFVPFIHSIAQSSQLKACIRHVCGYQYKLLKLHGDNSAFSIMFRDTYVKCHRERFHLCEDSSAWVPFPYFATIPVLFVSWWDSTIDTLFGYLFIVYFDLIQTHYHRVCFS